MDNESKIFSMLETLASDMAEVKGRLACIETKVDVIDMMHLAVRETKSAVDEVAQTQIKHEDIMLTMKAGVDIIIEKQNSSQKKNESFAAIATNRLLALGARIDEITKDMSIAAGD